MSITSEIHALEREIREYENNISELESAYENIKREQEIIENMFILNNRKRGKQNGGKCSES